MRHSKPETPESFVRSASICCVTLLVDASNNYIRIFYMRVNCTEIYKDCLRDMKKYEMIIKRNDNKKIIHEIGA